MTTRQFLHPRGQAGQAIVIVAFMIVVLFAAVGLAVDAGAGYYYNTAAERAAAAAALSGVIFMPNQFCGATVTAQCPTSSSIPVALRADASDRAVDEAKRNGFDVADAAHGVLVIPAPVPGFSNKLQVTVQRSAPTFFMGVFGINAYPVKRVAIATYLPPLTLGQPGSQLGSTVSQLGSGNNYYFQRNEGWSTNREEGDAFTPNPATAGSTDVHRISAVTGADTADPTLPTRGGYNFLVNMPAGGSIQVYNAAYGPDNAAPHNKCENARQGSPTAPIGPCSSGGSYYFHEEDGADFSNPPDSYSTFDAIEYTLFKVNSYFIRGSDSKQTQVKFLPIDATNWSAGQYKNVNSGATINQTYSPTGAPTNMLGYHNWADVATYPGTGDAGTVQWTAGFGPLAPGSTLPAGQYRLRVDSLNVDGSRPAPDTASGPGHAHKGYAVRVLDAAGNPCAACSLGAWDDMALYTPISISGGGAFAIPIFRVPPDYAGQTVSLDIYDPGDISGAGNVDLYVLDPSGAVSTATAPQRVTVTDLGVSRSNPNGTVVTAPLADPTQAFVEATTAGNIHFNGRWVRLDIPISASYAPGPNPNNWWWSLQYRTSDNVTATDTITFAVGLKGNPAHLLQS